MLTLAVELGITVPPTQEHRAECDEREEEQEPGLQQGLEQV